MTLDFLTPEHPHWKGRKGKLRWKRAAGLMRQGKLIGARSSRRVGSDWEEDTSVHCGHAKSRCYFVGAFDEGVGEGSTSKAATLLASLVLVLDELIADDPVRHRGKLASIGCNTGPLAFNIGSSRPARRRGGTLAQRSAAPRTQASKRGPGARETQLFDGPVSESETDGRTQLAGRRRKIECPGPLKPDTRTGLPLLSKVNSTMFWCEMKAPST